MVVGSLDKREGGVSMILGTKGLKGLAQGPTAVHDAIWDVEKQAYVIQESQKEVNFTPCNA
jgi:hypothetical protein